MKRRKRSYRGPVTFQMDTRPLDKRSQPAQTFGRAAVLDLLNMMADVKIKPLSFRFPSKDQHPRSKDVTFGYSLLFAFWFERVVFGVD